MSNIDQLKTMALDFNTPWETTIKFLEDNNMNVPAGLALAFKLWADTQGTTHFFNAFTIHTIVNKSTPAYHKYANEVEKYLMLV